MRSLLRRVFGGVNMPMNDADGIDVSNRNGMFDWASWEGHIDFAMVKCSEGLGFTDLEFARNWHWLKRIGVRRFAYHYGHPGEDPAKQARRFVDLVKAQGLEHGDNFVLDLEDTDGTHPIHVSFWAYVFMREVQRLAPHHRVLVYTYPAFAIAGNCAKLGSWHLWIANYEVSTPHVPLPWRNWAFWQFVGSPLDRDRFHGNYTDLQHFCTTTGPSGP